MKYYLVIWPIAQANLRSLLWVRIVVYSIFHPSTSAICHRADLTAMGSTGIQHGIDTTLPASWYRESGIYELEKRAIFSKQWLCVSHSLRFPNVGDFVSYEVAGYGFFVTRDRKKQLKAFLNVCRHRAYPVLEKESGTASILSCRYHGESQSKGENPTQTAQLTGVQDGRTAFREISPKLHGLRRLKTLTKPDIRCSRFTFTSTSWAGFGST